MAAPIASRVAILLLMNLLDLSAMDKVFNSFICSFICSFMGSVICDQPIAYSVLGNEVPWLCGIGFQFVAQLLHVDAQVVGILRMCVGPQTSPSNCLCASRPCPDGLPGMPSRRNSIGVRWTSAPARTPVLAFEIDASVAQRNRLVPAATRARWRSATRTRASNSPTPNGLVT